MDGLGGRMNWYDINTFFFFFELTSSTFEKISAESFVGQRTKEVFTDIMKKTKGLGRAEVRLREAPEAIKSVMIPGTFKLPFLKCLSR